MSLAANPIPPLQQMERRAQEEQRLLKIARHRYEGLLLELKHWGYADLPLKIDILQSCMNTSCSADTAATSTRAASSTAAVTYEDVYGSESGNVRHSQLTGQSCLFEDSVVTEATSAIAKRLNGHSSAMQVKQSIDQQAKIAKQLCETTRNCVLRYMQPEGSDSSEPAVASLAPSENHPKCDNAAKSKAEHTGTPAIGNPTRSPPSHDESRSPHDGILVKTLPVPSSNLSPCDSRLHDMSSEARRANRAVHVMSFARRCAEAATAQLAIAIIEIASEQLRLQKQQCVLLRGERDSLTAQVANATAAAEIFDHDSISYNGSEREVDDLDEAGHENDFNRCNSQHLSCSFSADILEEPSKLGLGTRRGDNLDSLQGTGSFDVFDNRDDLSAQAISFEAEKIDSALDGEKLQRLQADREKAAQQADSMRGVGAEEENKEGDPVISNNPRERARSELTCFISSYALFQLTMH